MEKEIAELKKIKGKAAGVVFKTDTAFIIKTQGKKGLKKIEEETKKMGWPIEYDKIKTYGWYPLGQRALSLLAAKRAFNWSDDKIREMGYSAPTHSLFIRMMAKYLVGLKRGLEKAEELFGKHYTQGKMIVEELNEEKKYLKIKLKDFKIHPIVCQVYLGEGYLPAVMKMMIKGKNITCKNTKCQFKGDSYHQWEISWE